MFERKILTKLQNAVKDARKELERKKAIENEIEQFVLSQNEYFIAPDMLEIGKETERILNPDLSWLMSEENFVGYLCKCHEEFIRRGYTDHEREMVWSYPAEKDLRVAEDTLLDYQQANMPESNISAETFKKMRNNLKCRDEMIKLGMAVRV